MQIALFRLYVECGFQMACHYPFNKFLMIFNQIAIYQDVIQVSRREVILSFTKRMVDISLEIRWCVCFDNLHHLGFA